MSNKRKPRPRLKRGTIHERCLEGAQKELAKAVERRTAALMEVDTLNVRIPYLQGLVAAHTPAQRVDDQPPMTFVVPAPEPPRPDSPPAPSIPPHAQMDQQEWLAKFWPRTSMTTTMQPPPPRPPAGNSEDNSEDPDVFLRDSGPGRDILS